MANEKTLIDVNEAVKLLRGSCVAKYPSTFLMGLFAAADEITKLPTVDAVEVVRCKDCKHFENGGRCKVPLGAMSECGYFLVDEYDFCSYGERRATNEAD